MKIGNFRVEAEPEQSLEGALESTLKSDVDVNQEVADKAKSYEDILKEAEIPHDKAQAIVDDMMTLGHYQEDMPITKSTSVTFRTRSYQDIMKFQAAVEALQPRFVEERNNIMTRYYLAASLVRFRDSEFKHPDPRKDIEEYHKAFDERLEYIEQLPERLVSLLSLKLIRFDRVVEIVLSEGVVENF